MRLREFSEPTSSAPTQPAQEGTLATLLRFLLMKVQKPGHEDQPVKIPTGVVLKMMNNTGASFSYEDLESLVEKSNVIKNIIKGPINRKEIEVGSPSAEPGPSDDDLTQFPQPQSAPQGGMGMGGMGMGGDLGGMGAPMGDMGDMDGMGDPMQEPGIGGENPAAPTPGEVPPGGDPNMMQQDPNMQQQQQQPGFDPEQEKAQQQVNKMANRATSKLK